MRNNFLYKALNKSVPIALMIFIFFSAFYVLTMSGHYGGDGFFIYLTARSIVLHGNLAINGSDFKIKEMAETAKAIPQVTNGNLYSKFGIGLALFEVPFFITGLLAWKIIPSIPQDYFTMLTVSATNCLVTALLCVLLYLFSLKLGFSRKTGVFISFAFGLSSMAWVFSRFSMTEPLQALTLVFAVYAIYCYKLEGKIKWVIFAGLASGYAVLTKLYLIGLLPFLALYLLYSINHQEVKDKTKVYLFYALPVAAFLIFLGVLNWVTFGKVFTFGGYTASARLRITYFEFFNNLYGFLLSSGKSVFIYFPLSILGLFFYRQFYERKKPEAILFAAIILSQLLFFSLIAADFAWHGDWTWGPRYLYLTLPFVILSLGPYFDEVFEGTRKNTPVLTLFVAGVLVQIPAVFMRMADYLSFVEKYKLEDLHFVPLLSPVYGGWLQIISAIKRTFFHSSLFAKYVLGSGIKSNVYQVKWVSFAGYDRVDLWFVQIISNFGGNRAIIFLVVCSLVILALISAFSLKKILLELKEDSLVH